MPNTTEEKPYLSMNNFQYFVAYLAQQYATSAEMNKKIDKVDGKGLSTNDFSTADKAKLDGISSGAQVNVIEKVKVDGNAVSIADKAVNIDLSTYAKGADLAGKVDKIEGKGLSENDFTSAQKSKLQGIESNAEVNVIESVKVNGTALSVSEKSVNVDLNGYATKTDVSNGYVAKAAGKGLSTNDYTTSEKEKLAAVAEGAQANVIESIKVNGSSLTPSGKAVNIDLSPLC